MAQTMIRFDHSQQAPRGIVFRIQLERLLQLLLRAIELTREGQGYKSMYTELQNGSKASTAIFGQPLMQAAGAH